MKTLKKISLIIVIALLGTNIAFAQGERQGKPQGPPSIPDEEQIAKMIEDLSAELSLDSEQEKKLAELYTGHYEKVEALQEQNKGSRGAGREAMSDLRSDLDKNVKALLSKEQLTKYNEWMKKQRQQRGRQGAGPQKQ